MPYLPILGAHVRRYLEGLEISLFTLVKARKEERDLSVELYFIEAVKLHVIES